MKLKIPVWLIIAGIIILDKIVKIYVLASNIRYSLNAGIAFGLSGNGWLEMLLILVLLGGLTWGALRYGKKYMLLWVVLAAGLANFSDRLIWGGVIDYIRVGSFPVFNLADILLVVAIVLIIIKLFLNSWKKPRH